jgi:hypothetical protein
MFMGLTMILSLTDRSADIARYIMHGDVSPSDDPRALLFDLYKVFWQASGDEFKRGIEIALEIYEATEVGSHAEGRL